MSIETNNHKQLYDPLYCRKDDEERGRYMVAAKPIPKGRLIFCERPLVALQSLGNPVWVCHNCKAFVGGPNAALHILSTQSMPDTNEKEENTSWRTVPCRYSCGQVYCSKKCEADFWEDRHRYLCTGRISDPNNHPLIQFKQHAVATNEIFLLVAEWMVAEHSYRKQHPQDDNDNPFEDFLMEPWWDLDSPKDKEEEEGQDTNDLLKELCQEASNYWKQHWDLLSKEDEEPEMEISPLRMANIIGACELNAIGIRRRNPLCRDIASKELRSTGKKEVLSCLRQAGMLGAGEDEGSEDGQPLAEVAEDTSNVQGLATVTTLPSEEPAESSEPQEDEWSYTDDDLAGFLAGLDIHEEERTEKARDSNEDCEDNKCEDHEHSSEDNQDDLDVLFPPMDGTAMYALTCKMNHSCEPNVVVQYKTRGWGAQHPLVAYCIVIRDIEEGEELCISYIDSDNTLATRQEALKHYGFTCNCCKCQREMSSGCDADGHGTKDESAQSANRDEDYLFGSDDSESEADQVEGNIGNGSGPEDQLSNEDANGEMALEQVFEWLDTALNNSSSGSIPIQSLAQASALAIQTATIAKEGLRHEEENLSNLLEKCIHSLRERDFVLARTAGADLESSLFSMLKKESKWPSPAFREAFWSAAVTAAIGLAHQCGFLSAIEYLDKALILGLDRPTVGDFFAYVELHASQMAQNPCPPAVASQDCIRDYNLIKYQHILRSNGLSQPIQYPLPECLQANTKEIQASYISQSKPVVLRQYAVTWPAIQKWRHLSFFCRLFGHRLVPIELGSMKSKSGMKEELMTVQGFASSYLAESATRVCWTLQDSAALQGSVAYLAQHPLIAQLPALGTDISMRPSLCGKLGPSHVYLWIGTGGTRTPLHFDSYSNLFVQLVGVKYCRIYAKEETPKLYVSENKSYGLQGNMSDVDCEQEDFSLHPLAKDAVYQEVLLFPGDALFIPARSWHYVRSLTTSVSVNFWF